MTKQVIEFLENWVSNNIFAEGYEPEGDDSEARVRAAQCVEAAKAKGITSAQIEASVGDLVSYMASAIESANDQEIARLAAKD